MRVMGGRDAEVLLHEGLEFVAGSMRGGLTVGHQPGADGRAGFGNMAVAAILKRAWPLAAGPQPEAIGGGAADEQSGCRCGIVPCRSPIHRVHQASFRDTEVRLIHEHALTRVAALMGWPTRGPREESISCSLISV